MMILLIGCQGNLQPESQGKKMTTFFNNNNNTNLPKLTHHQSSAGLVTKQLPTTEQSLTEQSLTEQSLTKQLPTEQSLTTQLPTKQSLTKQLPTTQSLQPRLSADFIRDQATELETLFPKLPNPTLNMFIYPHLTTDGNPVPAYTTNFKLYKVDHYALPREVL